MSRAQEVAALKNQMAVIGSDPVMESHGNISTLNSLLIVEQQACSKASSENSTLNKKSSEDKSTLIKLQEKYDSLIAVKKNQEAIVAKIDSYLTDFNDKAIPTPLGDELAQKLSGDLSKLDEE